MKQSSRSGDVHRTHCGSQNGASSACIEQLEGRVLLSVGDAHPLIITGTPGPDRIKIRARYTTLIVRQNGVLQRYHRSEINAMEIDTLGGNDRIIIGQRIKRIATIHGGPGSDTILGGGGNDIINGDAGRDLLDGGRGADQIFGGDGTDTADYSTRTASLIVTIDNIADDGEVNEKDNIRTDVENVLGGDGDDSIAGSPIANRLIGGDGADMLDGSGGDDMLIGGLGEDNLLGSDGNDMLLSRDGEVDTLVGGEGRDLVRSDLVGGFWHTDRLSEFEGIFSA